MKNTPLKSIVTCVTFLFYVMHSPFVFAEATPTADPEKPKILTLKKGEAAPFAGTLFNTSASAKLIVDLEYNEETCKLEIDKKVKLIETKLNLDISLLQAKYDALEDRNTKVLKIKDDQITFLESKIKPEPWYSSSEFLFSMGVIGGILVTVAAGYAIGQASK